MSANTNCDAPECENLGTHSTSPVKDVSSWANYIKHEHLCDKHMLAYETSISKKTYYGMSRDLYPEKHCAWCGLAQATFLCCIECGCEESDVRLFRCYFCQEKVEKLDGKLIYGWCRNCHPALRSRISLISVNIMRDGSEVVDE